MSDLQCPARLVLLTRRSAAAAAPAVADDLAAALASERVAIVYTGPASADVLAADQVSARLQVAARVSHALGPDGTDDTDHTDGRAGRERDIDAAARLATELDSIADVHRGETVLVVCEQHAATAALTLRSAGQPASGGHARPSVPGWTLTTVDVDSDGWVTRASG